MFCLCPVAILVRVARRDHPSISIPSKLMFRGDSYRGLCHLCLQAREACTLERPTRRGKRRREVAALLQRGEWVEGIHPQSPLVLEAIEILDMQREQCEQEVAWLRRASHQLQMHQPQATRGQRGQPESEPSVLGAGERVSTEP